MVTFLIIVIAILLGVIFFQYRVSVVRKRDIKYIIEKLKRITGNNTEEKLMLFTADKELIELLIEINSLLEYARKAQADYNSTEMSMRKMLSNISHDLKTPLTVVLGYIETMRQDENLSAEERQAHLLKVQNKANEVLELIRKFFDLAKLEAGDKDLPLTKTDMNEICRKNILDFYELLTGQGLEVSIDIPDTTVYALANEEALSRIMNNLISNSIKYGSEGKVIGVELRYDEKHVYVDIWDKGRGIEEIHKDRVFERLYTLEDSRNKEYDGSGLGLTITKRLMDKLHGEISLVSRPYEKTTFTLKFKRLQY